MRHGIPARPTSFFEAVVGPVRAGQSAKALGARRDTHAARLSMIPCLWRLQAAGFWRSTNMLMLIALHWLPGTIAQAGKPCETRPAVMGSGASQHYVRA